MGFSSKRSSTSSRNGYLKHILSISVFEPYSCSLSRRRTIVPTRLQMFLLLRSNHLNTDSSSFRHSLHKYTDTIKGAPLDWSGQIKRSRVPRNPRSLDWSQNSCQETFPCDCIDRNFTNTYLPSSGSLRRRDKDVDGDRAQKEWLRLSLLREAGSPRS